VGFIIVLLLPGRPGSVWKVEGAIPNPGARRPLGIPALGPVAGVLDTPEATGPALPDAGPALPDTAAPPPSDGPRSAEPPSDGPRSAEPPSGGES
jgi:hypothetical protein